VLLLVGSAVASPSPNSAAPLQNATQNANQNQNTSQTQGNDVGQCMISAYDDSSASICDACLSLAGSGGGRTTAELLPTALSFPPYGKTSLDAQLQVAIHATLIRIDAVDVEAGKWTVRLQLEMYWDAGRCQDDKQLADLCAAPLSDIFYFGTPQQVMQPLGATINGRLQGDGIFSGAYERGSCLHGDFVDATFTLGHSYEPIYFPFEAYKLEFRLVSFADNVSVVFNVLEEHPEPVFENDLPDNWYSQNALVCREAPSCSNMAMRGGLKCYSEVKCSVVLKAFSESYCFTVLVFWIVVVLCNLLGGMGVVAATARAGLREALINRGVFTGTFVLAYVFVVPPRPHGIPLKGNFPTSTALFVVGLCNLILSTFWSFVLAQFSQIWLRDLGLYQRWWHVFVQDDEIAMGLRRVDEERRSRSADASIADAAPSKRAGPRLPFPLKPSAACMPRRLPRRGPAARLQPAPQPAAQEPRPHDRMPPPAPLPAPPSLTHTRPAAPELGKPGQLSEKEQLLLRHARMAKIDVIVWLGINLAAVAMGAALIFMADRGATTQVEQYINEI